MKTGNSRAKETAEQDGVRLFVPMTKEMREQIRVEAKKAGLGMASYTRLLLSQAMKGKVSVEL